MSLRNSRLIPVPLDASVHHDDPVLHITRRAKQLQLDLQTLLDAQSEALLAGQGGQDGTSSNGTRTPSSDSPRAHTHTIPVRQPSSKTITLPSARRGISRTMASFHQLKDEEAHLLAHQLTERDSALSSIDHFTSKRAGLESSILSITSEPSAQRAQRLTSEANTLEHQIQEFETQLLEMHARHRSLVAEAASVENSVQSKTSSYKASLSLLDSQVKQFLKRPPVERLAPLDPRQFPHLEQDENFYTLLPARRTLEMAKEHWTHERLALTHERQNVELERDALREGGAVWGEVVREVTNFEQSLRREMASAASKHKLSPQDEGSGMRELLQQMGDTMRFLEVKLSLAEAKDWKLLICSIGAELEAFRAGRHILLDALGMPLVATLEAAANEGEADLRQTRTFETDASSIVQEPILEGSNSREGDVFSANTGPETREGKTERYRDDVDKELEEDEDDGPPADFLISPRN